MTLLVYNRTTAPNMAATKPPWTTGRAAAPLVGAVVLSAVAEAADRVRDEVAEALDSEALDSDALAEASELLAAAEALDSEALDSEALDSEALDAAALVEAATLAVLVAP